ncbi:hypothetical protein [Nostoc sp.]|uniref:hypothetical protein n=1 Tax=Nostoc sp. TaxID=1180 RepID=UPI002FF9D119
MAAWKEAAVSTVLHKIVAFLNAERCLNITEGYIGIAEGRIGIAEGRIGIAEGCIGIAEGCISIAEGRIGIAEGCISIAEGRIGIAEIYSYFQVNRPRGRGTAMLIGVNFSPNPFKTSFLASGWKCKSIAALPLVLRRQPPTRHS